MKKTIPVEKGKKYPIEIVSMGHTCEGVGKYEDFTIFVPYALPGEQLEVAITEVKKSYAKGKIAGITKSSPYRVDAKCANYHQCGGCQLQHLDYQEQLKVKQQQIIDALLRIGKQENIVVHPTIGSENPWNYRNKMQFPIARNDNDVIIGCFAQGSHRIINTENCFIQHESNNVIANAVRGIVKRLNISTYDEKNGKGALRHVIGRVGSTGEIMVVLVTNTDVLPKKEKFVAELRNNIPGLVSVMQNINSQRTNVILGHKMLNLWGKMTIADKLGEFTFNISGRSFFQVNTKQAELLYNKAVEYAELTGEETVIDAYCGTGTITLFLAKKAKTVYGIEIMEQAVKDANRNAEFNHVKNTEFIVGDTTKVMPKLYDEGICPDVIVVDPPRSGCERTVLEAFVNMKPDRIIYVSCNPASLARDIAILDELGYRAVEVQPVDMFSETSHVESVTKLIKKN